jgi:hypothetical protein
MVQPYQGKFCTGLLKVVYGINLFWIGSTANRENYVIFPFVLILLK